MTRFIIQGACGRMGQTLNVLISQREDCRIVAGIDVHVCEDVPYPIFPSPEPCTVEGDVLIDFSHPEATRAALAYCAAKRLPCVICTTGLGEAEKQAMQAASTKTAVFYSANMSLGINLLTRLVQRAAAALPGFDIEIVEKHHHNKLDAPSGTAMALADAINLEMEGRYHYVYDRHDAHKKRSPDEIGLHAVRGGSIVGEHDVLFAGPDEVLTLSHTAYSRDVFANGAIAAGLFVAGKVPGRYSMQDLLAGV